MKQNSQGWFGSVDNLYALCPTSSHEAKTVQTLLSLQHPHHHTLKYLLMVCLQCLSFSVYLNLLLKVPSSPWSQLKYSNPYILFPLNFPLHLPLLHSHCRAMMHTSKFHETLNTLRPNDESQLDSWLIKKQSFLFSHISISYKLLLRTYKLLGLPWYSSS